MNNPFAAINAHGDGLTRGVTQLLPSDCVRNLLPDGLELGPQDITPKGTHPVILLFHDLFRARFSLPTFFPAQTYREYSMGVPFTCLSRDSITPGLRGPYYYMPRLYLDNLSATAVGMLGWGFTKHVASIEVTGDRYSISGSAGRRLTSLVWSKEASGEHRPMNAWPNFASIRAMLEQPLISRVPATLGPFFMLSDFDRDWSVATLRPMRTTVEVDLSFVTGYPTGRFPESGWSPGIDEAVLGSYELIAPWRLSLLYPPLFSFRQPSTATG